MKLIAKPDYDPNNPYHYHNEKGEKIVIEPEVWEANVGQPYFKNVEDAVNAERAAHPGPEYEVDTEWLKRLEDVHRAAARDYAGFQNYRNYPQGLPEGWRFTDDGMIIDNNGNYYVQRGLNLGNGYNIDYSRPYKHTINAGKPIESSRFYYPVEMQMVEKKPLKVDRVVKLEDVTNAKKKNIAVSNNKSVTIKKELKKEDKEPIFNFRFVYPYRTTGYIQDATIKNKNSFITGLKNALNSEQIDTLIYDNGIFHKKNTF